MNESNKKFLNTYYTLKETLTLWLDLDLVSPSKCVLSPVKHPAPFSSEMFNWHSLCRSDSETADYCLLILLQGRLHSLFTAPSLLEGASWSGPPRKERRRMLVVEFAWIHSSWSIMLDLRRSTSPNKCSLVLAQKDALHSAEPLIWEKDFFLKREREECGRRSRDRARERKKKVWEEERGEEIKR